MTKITKKLFFPYLLIMYEVILYLSNDMYLPSMPTIANDLLLTEHEIQSSLTLWFLGASSLQLILGPVSDRYGRRVVILSGAIAFIIASVFCAIANSLTTLLLARFIQGAAICSLVAGYAAVNESFATKKAIKLFAIIGAITVLAPALGPIFGSIVVQFASWRYIFWLLAIANIVTFVLLFLFLPETNAQPRKINLSSVSSNYYKIVTNKNFIIPCVAYSLIVAVEFLWAFESPFIMMEIYNTSVLFYGIAQTVIFGSFILGAGATKWLLDYFSIKALMKSGLTITIFGTISFWLVSVIYPTIIAGIVCMMIIALGSSMLVAPLTRIALESCKQPAGAVTAIFAMATNLSGVAIGILLILNRTNSLYSVATAAMIIISLAAILILHLKIPKKKATEFKDLF